MRYHFEPVTEGPDRHAAGVVRIVARRHHRASTTGIVYKVRNVDTGRAATALPGELEPIADLNR